MRFLSRLIGLIFLLNISAALAQAAPSVWPGAYLEQALQRLENGEISQVLQELVSLSASHAGDSEFDYFLGITALKAQRYDLALDALERVVLVQPQHAGAWLDLAIVYHRLGDHASALGIIEHVQNNFSPSPALQLQLKEVATLLGREAARNGWRREVSAFMGRVSNANSGVNESSFLLTPSGVAPILVEVAPSQRARPSAALTGRVAAGRTLAGSTAKYHEVFLSAGTRHFFSEPQSNQTDLYASLATSQAMTDQWRLYWGATFRAIDQGQQGAVAVTSLFASAARPAGACLWGARLEPEWRSYQGSEISSSLTSWVAVTGRCVGPGPLQWFGVLRFGLDNPFGQRAGGKTERWELALQVRKPINTQLSLDAGLFLGDYQDRQGYNSLISQGAPRRVERRVARLGAEWALDAYGLNNMFAIAYYEKIIDRSNIPIFGLEDRQYFFGARYELP
jgi:tetratricopeptide (TPR) repeat protein